jgi:hypothetical protein
MVDNSFRLSTVAESRLRFGTVACALPCAFADGVDNRIRLGDAVRVPIAR